MLETFIKQFNNNINGIREFIELIDPILKKNHEDAAAVTNQYIKAFELAEDILNCTNKDEIIIKENEIKQICHGELIFAERIKVKSNKNKRQHSKITINVPIEINHYLIKAFNKSNQTENQKQLLYTNSLISLISSVEWFYSQILHFYYNNFPDSAGIKKKTLTLEDLKTFNNFQDAEKYLIDNKIEEIFRSGFETWLEILTNELKLNINFAKPYLNELIEFYQRRNILIHNGGITNSIYVAKVDKNQRQGIKIGDKISITELYLENAINKFFIVFVLIASEIWKKFEPTNKDRGELLSLITYENMKNKNWIVAQEISNFNKNDKYLSSEAKTVGQLNYWLCKKNIGGYSEIEEEIKLVDYSDKSLRYQIALFALKNDVINFFKNVTSALQSKILLVEELLDYPIFEEIRNSSEFEKFKINSKELNEYIKFNENDIKNKAH